MEVAGLEPANLMYAKHTFYQLNYTPKNKVNIKKKPLPIFTQLTIGTIRALCNYSKTKKKLLNKRAC